VLRLQDLPVPEAGPGQVLVRVRACGVNHIDLWAREGKLPIRIPLPHVSGSEVTGEVAQVGPGVEGVAIGQRVAVHPYLHDGTCEYCLAGEESTCLRGDILGMVSQGGYAEYVRVPANSVVPLPEGLGFVEAAAVTLATLTAWHMLVAKARVRPGETVLVLAAGSGIGVAAVQIARLAGARVIAAASSEEKLAVARGLGAEETVNYTTEDLREAVRRITGKRGVDVVVEHVGAATWEQSLACLTRNGRLVTCGATTGSEVRMDLWPFFVRQITAYGAYGGTRAELQRVLQLTARGLLKPVVARVLPLAALPEAQEALQRRQVVGKLVVEP
jgi:NADPH:quinone reductase-like Zn-dependent oxidoreductase